MRKAILSAVGTVAMAAGLAGCGSGGASTGAGMMSSVGGTSSHHSAATGGGGPTAAATGTTDSSGSTDGSGTTDGTRSAASTAASGGCKPQIFISFCEKIAITGAVTVNGTGAAIPQFDQDGNGGLSQTCATWPTYQPKHPDGHDLTLPADPVDGHKLLMLWPFAAGVGTSDIAKYAGTNSIIVDGAGFDVVAVDVNHTTASSGSVRVNADGSGSLSFKDLSGKSGDISGTITWTCVDSQ